MAQVFKKRERDRELIVWKIEEPMSYFLSRLPEEMHSLPSENETRNLEWLASRYILSLLVPEARISTVSYTHLDVYKRQAETIQLKTYRY